jgi:hypothetical protein
MDSYKSLPVCGWARKKVGRGIEVVFTGVLGILVCFVVVNRGEFVVNCVVNRGIVHDVFRRQKTRHFS